MSKPFIASLAARNRQTAISLSMLGLGMVMLAYAAVPLYQLFCQVTGFGGTTQRSDAQTTPLVLDAEMTVSFNADTDRDLPWKFKPLQRDVTFKIGESVLVAYEAVNNSPEPVTGMATYNVTPFEAGAYFHKVQCFCYEQQTLAPNQRVDMPISFYVDPAIKENPYLKNLEHITLSYTFFNQSSKNE